MDARRVYKCDKITMRILEEYPSLVAAGNANGRGYTSIAKTCKERHVGRDRYVLRYAEDYDPKETFEGKKVRPVLCIDARTREVRAYYSADDAAKATRIRTWIVNDCIRNGAPYGRWWFKHAR
jgi:hypothetical protein